jgi:hypothetical protein
MRIRSVAWIWSAHCYHQNRRDGGPLAGISTKALQTELKLRLMQRLKG